MVNRIDRYRIGKTFIAITNVEDACNRIKLAARERKRVMYVSPICVPLLLLLLIRNIGA